MLDMSRILLSVLGGVVHYEFQSGLGSGYLVGTGFRGEITDVVKVQVLDISTD